MTESKKCNNDTFTNSELTFKSLGVSEALCESCARLKWERPTKIQQQALPVAFRGSDIIGLAETGSGKTGAFVLPIIQALSENLQSYFALVLTPTRELAHQISEQFEALGAFMKIKVAVIIGGKAAQENMMTQALALAKKPHVIIATPGRLVDHLENTKGFSLRSLKYLVMDEADKCLEMDFEQEINKILEALPKERKTYLYSATMTAKVNKLQRVSLKNPTRVEVSTKYQTVDKLSQFYVFLPAKEKNVHLAYFIRQGLPSANSFMVFCNTCTMTQQVALMLRNLDIMAIPLYGKMNQDRRLAALDKFKEKARSVLVATDLASRGLDCDVDMVINFDMPQSAKDYVHRVGRTARMGRDGMAVTFVTQYDVIEFQNVEKVIGKMIPEYKIELENVLELDANVSEANRQARVQIGHLEYKKKRKGRSKEMNEDESGTDEDTEESLGVRKKLKKKRKNR